MRVGFCLKFPQYQKVRGQAGTDGELDAWQTDRRRYAPASSAPVVGVEGRWRQTMRLGGPRTTDACTGWPGFYSSLPYAGSVQQIRSAGRLLGQFHREGAKLVAADARLREQISRHLYRDMPLDDSLANLDRIEASLSDRKRTDPVRHAKP